MKIEPNCFDQKKTYYLTFERDEQILIYTGHDINYIGVIISFTDKYGQHIAFHQDDFREAHEVKP